MTAISVDLHLLEGTRVPVRRLAGLAFGLVWLWFPAVFCWWLVSAFFPPGPRHPAFLVGALSVSGAVAAGIGYLAFKTEAGRGPVRMMALVWALAAVLPIVRYAPLTMEELHVEAARLPLPETLELVEVREQGGRLCFDECSTLVLSYRSTGSASGAAALVEPLRRSGVAFRSCGGDGYCGAYGGVGLRVSEPEFARGVDALLAVSAR